MLILCGWVHPYSKQIKTRLHGLEKHTVAIFFWFFPVGRGWAASRLRSAPGRTACNIIRFPFLRSPFLSRFSSNRKGGGSHGTPAKP